MHILMISNVRNTRTEGVARIMHFLREATISQGHKMDLLFADDVPDPFRSHRLTGLTFPILVLLAIYRLGKTNSPYDIVNIHTLSGSAYVFLRRVLKRLPPCVIMSYGADELRWKLEMEEHTLGLRQLGLKSRTFYYNVIIRQARYATRHADHVITAARSENDFYVKAYGRQPASVTFIPNGVGEEFFIERHYRCPPAALLFLGGWEWRKGTRYLVEGFSQIARDYPHVTLSLVGTGSSEEGIKSSFPAHLRDRLRIIPRVAAEELPSIYAQHDIFVFPSLFESMSLVVPEAMASGMPVVTTRACGMQDIVEDGVSGLLVPPRNPALLAKQIAALLNDPRLCERLGRAAQQKAREITWNCIARQTLAVYERLLGEIA